MNLHRLIWVVSTLLLVATLFFGVWWLQRSFIYYPEHLNPGAAADRFDRGTDVQLHTDDGLTLHAWKVAPATPNGKHVIYFPGNAGNRLSRVEVAEEMASAGFEVLLVEYRGFGGNPGSPSEAGLILDAQAAVDHMQSSGHRLEDIIYVGESLGTGVATAMASKATPGALLLRSPFTSLPDMAGELTGLPVGWLVRDRFDTLTRIRDVDCPVTVLAGDADEVVPWTQSASVASAAPNLHEFKVYPGIGHNDAIWFGEGLVSHLVSLSEALS